MRLFLKFKGVFVSEWLLCPMNPLQITAFLW